MTANQELILESLTSLIMTVLVSKFLYNLYYKRKQITLLVDGCADCPMMVHYTENKYGCKLATKDGNMQVAREFQDLKKYCPINGKLEITISKQ